MIQQLPLLRKKGLGWERAVSVSQRAILIERCLTPEMPNSQVNRVASEVEKKKC